MKFRSFLAMVITALVFFSCSSDKVTDFDKKTESDILIGGRRYYWLNDTRYDLPEGAMSVFWDGTDVYVAGSNNSEEYPSACYWKNGIRTDLGSNINNTSVANKIIVDGDDVYALGWHASTGNQINCWWKNGIRNDLVSLFAGSIDVYEGCVYIGGVIWSTTNIGKRVLGYWKDNDRVDLLEEDQAGVSTIKVINGDIYVLGGYYSEGIGNNWHYCYWKNGIRVDFATPDFWQTYIPRALTVVNDDVYIAGDGEGKVFYWKGDSLTVIDHDEYDLYLYSDGIAVTKDGNVYLPGYFKIPPRDTRYACWYKDGIMIDISEGLESNAGTIFISD